MFLDSIKETCYTTRYPFNIFRYRNVPQLEFEPLTIFYGGNGSGKTTLLNMIAERRHFAREAVYNRSGFFEDYVRECSYKMADEKTVPPGSRIITSDDVFDYLLDIRCINQGIDTERVKLFDQYISTHSPFLLSMQGAKIYDLDSDPIGVKPWTELENVKTYYGFFKSHEKEFF